MKKLQQMLEEKRRECEKLSEENDKAKVSLSKYKARLEDAEKRSDFLNSLSIN